MEGSSVPAAPYGEAVMAGKADPGFRTGKTVVHQLSVSLEDLYNGTTRKLSLQKNIICRKCGGEHQGTRGGPQHRSPLLTPPHPSPQAVGCGRVPRGGVPSATARAWRCGSISWGPA